MPDPLTTVDNAVGLATSMLSILVSIFAIWQALYFYRMSNDAAARLSQAIADLAVSARSTEVTTTQVTTRALDVLAGHFERRVEQAETESRLRVAETVAHALAQATPRERHEAQAAATRAVSEAFVRLKTSVAPTSEEYDWGPFIRRIDELQRNNAYLSIKWLHQQVFASEPGMQEALQIAIELGILDTYHRPNPRRPRYPTLCCRLNRDDATARAALDPGASNPTEKKRLTRRGGLSIL